MTTEGTLGPSAGATDDGRDRHSGLRSFRVWVDEQVFPEAPSPPRLSLRRAVVCLVLGLVGVAVELTRMWSSRPLNSIWAEDGATWLGDALHRGFFDTLTTPYDGYLQTSSRLLGKLISAFPVGSFAAGMAVAGASLVTACAWIVWRASAGHIADPLLRGTLAGLVILLPIADVELLANVTNSIWFLLFAALWILLWRPTTVARAALAAGMLLLATISNIGILVLAPVWVLRLLVIRDRRDGVIVAAFAVGVAVQLGFSWSDLNMSGETGTIQGSLTPHWDWGLLPAYSQRIVGGAVAGNTVTGFLWEHVGTLFEVLLSVLLATFVGFASRIRESGVRLLVPLVVAISLLLFLGTGYQRWQSGGSQFLWPHGSFNNEFSRYMVVPSLLLLTALFIQLGRARDTASPPAGLSRRRATAGLLVIAALLSFNAANATLRGTPTWSNAVAAARSYCQRTYVGLVRLPVAPTIIPGAFVLPLSCSDLESKP